MIRKILWYCIDIIIGIVVLLGLSITEKVRWMFSAEEIADKIPNGNGPKTGVEDMSALYLAGMISSLLVMLYMVYKKETE